MNFIALFFWISGAIALCATAANVGGAGKSTLPKTKLEKEISANN